MDVCVVLYSKEKGANHGNQDKETSTKKEQDIESRKKKTSGGILENFQVT
jgi:hypothetical protein